MPELKDTFKVWGKKLLTRITKELGRIFKRIKSNKHVERLSQYLEHLAAENSVLLPILVAATSLVIVAIASLYFWIDHFGKFFENVMVEAHGMVFDLIVISSFVFWLQKRGEKKQRIQRYKEELEDYRPWQAEEATWRIVGLIRRLNKENIGDIDLRGARLQGAKLHRAYLHGAKLTLAYLQGAKLDMARLQGAKLEAAKLQGAILVGANLKMANLEGAKLEAAKLQGANLEEANLRGADLYEANFQRTKNLTVDQLCSAKTLYQAKLDPELENQVKEKCPHLIEPPDEQ